MLEVASTDELVYNLIKHVSTNRERLGQITQELHGLGTMVRNSVMRDLADARYEIDKIKWAMDSDDNPPPKSPSEEGGTRSMRPALTEALSLPRPDSEGSVYLVIKPLAAVGAEAAAERLQLDDDAAPRVAVYISIPEVLTPARQGLLQQLFGFSRRRVSGSSPPWSVSCCGLSPVWTDCRGGSRAGPVSHAYGVCRASSVRLFSGFQGRTRG